MKTEWVSEIEKDRKRRAKGFGPEDKKELRRET